MVKINTETYNNPEDFNDQIGKNKNTFMSSEQRKEVQDTYSELLEIKKIWGTIEWIPVQETELFKSLEKALKVSKKAEKIITTTKEDISDLKVDINSWDEERIQTDEVVQIDENWNAVPVKNIKETKWQHCEGWVCYTDLPEQKTENKPKVEQTWANTSFDTGADIVEKSENLSNFEVNDKWYVELSENDFQKFINQNHRVSFTISNNPWDCPWCENLKSTLSWNTNSNIAVTYNDSIIMKVIDKYSIKLNHVPRTIIFENWEIAEDLWIILNNKNEIENALNS